MLISLEIIVPGTVVYCPYFSAKLSSCFSCSFSFLIISYSLNFCSNSLLACFKDSFSVFNSFTFAKNLSLLLILFFKYVKLFSIGITTLLAIFSIIDIFSEFVFENITNIINIIIVIIIPIIPLFLSFSIHYLLFLEFNKIVFNFLNPAMFSLFLLQHNLMVLL